jgi:hypothetical protein
MTAKKSEDAIRKYMESATPEEQRQLADAFLDSKSRASTPEHKEVPRRFVVASRILSLISISLVLMSIEWNADDARWVIGMCFVGALAWFPNEISRATGRLGIGTPIRRPSNPWVVLFLAWIFLLLPIVASIVDWSRAV